MKNKIPAAVMALVLLFGLTACGSSAKPDVAAADIHPTVNSVKNDDITINSELQNPELSGPYAIKEFEKEYPLGTAGELEGKTIVVTVFINDPSYSWDFDSETDQKTIAQINSYLKTAGDYIVETAKSYGTTSEFVTDFIENPDLCYAAQFDKDAEAQTDFNLNQIFSGEVNFDVFNYVCQYIDNYIDTESLKEKYNADNVIYISVLNTDSNFDGVSCTYSYMEGYTRPYEVCCMYNTDYKLQNPPAVYAHEMLHAFGALDLYEANSEFGITEDFVKYVKENMPNDIMYQCIDLTAGTYIYDKITNEVSDLDAYYVGLKDSCDLVKEFDLVKSEH